MSQCSCDYYCYYCYYYYYYYYHYYHYTKFSSVSSLLLVGGPWVNAGWQPGAEPSRAGGCPALV